MITEHATPLAHGCCPQCNQPLTAVGKFLICPQHGQVSLEKPSVPMRIFLSYGHDANEELVRRIRGDLEKRGHDVWFDKSEIRFGDDWRREITDGIVNSNRVLSFLSKYSTRDPGVCLDELAIAIGVKGGNIQTVLVESETDVKAPPSIGHIQWLDMHDWKEQRAVGEPVWEDWYQGKLAEIIRVIESDESRRFAGEIETLNGHLKPISSDSRVAALLRRSFVGRAWLFEAVDKWRNANDCESRLFWIVGDPGVGKSAFAARLTHFGRDKVIAAQFVEWDKPDHRNAPQVVRSLAFQLATRLPDYRKLLLALPEIADLDRMEPADLFDYLLANPLRTSIDGGRERFLIVVDALDEASEDGRNILAEMLARDALRLPAWLSFVFTSRPESAVTTPLQAVNPLFLDAVSDNNRDDICEYLRRQLSSQLGANPERLLEQILAKSEGVFLYAERFCFEVQQGRLSLDRPDQFPRGLGGIFFQYFQRQFPDLKTFRKDVRPALRVILAAREPLPLEILKHLLKWKDEDLHDFARSLGSLFPIATESGVESIKPFHKSLADWLSADATAGTYFVSVLDGHRALAAYGLSALSQRSEPFGGYIKYHLPRHLREANDALGLMSALANPEVEYFDLWAEQGMAAEGVRCLEFLYSHLVSSSTNRGAMPIIATQLGRLCNRLSDPAAAEHWLKIAITPTEDSSEHDLTKAVAWHELGSSALSRGDYSAAHLHYRRALRISRRATPSLFREIGANLIGLAITAYLTGPHTERTILLGTLALKYAEKSEDATHIAEACRVLADGLKDDMQHAAAERYLEHGLQIAERNNLTHARLSLLTSKAWTVYQRFALEEVPSVHAEAAFRTLLHYAESAHDWRFEADAWSGLGQVAMISESTSLLDEAISRLHVLDRQPQQPHITARWRLFEAARLQRSGQLEEARRLYAALADFCKRKNLWSRQVDAMIGQGTVAFHSGNTREAEVLWEEAQTVLRLCPRIRRALYERTIRACRQSPRACPL